MKRLLYLIVSIIGVSTILGTGTSCKREMFNEEEYDTLIKNSSPVDTVDPNHTWSLTESNTIKVTVNAGVDTKKIQILNDNPLTSESAQVITQMDANEGDQVRLGISYPSYRDVLYLAGVDSEGKYTIATFNPSDNEVDFKNMIIVQRQLGYTPQPQYYAFCYEQEYPEPGDYDFNDVVMHIALERASTNVMYVHVRLAAVGADQQLAGCIRLPEIPFEEIDSVWTVNGASFNQDITSQYMMVLKERDLLLKGLNGEPVLNLFADAHWATGDNLDANYGMFKRKQYNVTKTTGSDAQLMVPREIVFGMRVKKGDLLTSMSLDNIDPFIIRQYNGSNMEIHTYDYRKINALNSYNFIDAGNIPWALKIPYGWFCHPLHGVNIGFRLEGQGTQYLFGAYRRSGNSFGEWSMNHLVSLRWFLPENATTNQVFVW